MRNLPKSVQHSDDNKDQGGKRGVRHSAYFDILGRKCCSQLLALLEGQTACGRLPFALLFLVRSSGHQNELPNSLRLAALLRRYLVPILEVGHHFHSHLGHHRP